MTTRRAFLINTAALAIAPAVPAWPSSPVYRFVSRPRRDGIFAPGIFGPINLQPLPPTPLQPWLWISK